MHQIVHCHLHVCITILFKGRLTQTCLLNCFLIYVSRRKKCIIGITVQRSKVLRKENNVSLTHFNQAHKMGMQD